QVSTWLRSLRRPDEAQRPQPARKQVAKTSLQEPVAVDELPARQPREASDFADLHMCGGRVVLLVLRAIFVEPPAHVLFGARLPAARAVDQQLVLRHLSTCGDVLGAMAFLQRRLRRGEAGQRNAVRRAADVVEAQPVAELDGPRLAAVLAADP